MTSPSPTTEITSAMAPTQLEGSQVVTNTNSLILSLTSTTPSSPRQTALQTEIQNLNLLPINCYERNGDDTRHNQHPMANIPEHENEHIERAVLHPTALSEYNTASNYMNNSILRLEILARFANPLNIVDVFNPVNELSNMAYFPQYNLQEVMEVPMALDNPLDHTTDLEPSPPMQQPARVSAYAKLIFEDGFFYMNTYSVVLGRDLQAWHAAMREEKWKQRRVSEEGTQARDQKTPVHPKHEGSRYSRSIVSESGGILRTGNNSDSEERARRRKLRKLGKASKKSKSTGSSDQNSRRNSIGQPNKFKVYEAQNLQSTLSNTDGPVPVDPAMLRPSPYDCPLVAIHPPATAPISAYKSISREHVKITFNSRKSKFEAHIIGRNGCFVQDQWYHTSDVVPLESGDFLQVGGIRVQFMLPNQLDPTTVVEYSEYTDGSPTLDRDSEVGKEVDDESGEIPWRDIKQSSVKVGSTSDADDIRSCDERDSDDMDEDEDPEQENNEELNVAENYTQEVSLDQAEEGYIEADAGISDTKSKITLGFKLGRKRGPGRPPKNGILSKREQKLLKKEDQVLFEAMVKERISKPKEKDRAKKKIKDKILANPAGSNLKESFSGVSVDQSADNVADNSTEVFTEQSAEISAEHSLSQLPGIPIKNRVGRPRKHSLHKISTEPPREKRKYTKRKPKEPKQEDVNASGSGEETKIKKEKIPPRPPRSPSPVMNEEDFTPEQLAKPQSNYVTLIHEALSNAPTQQLGLPDIYRAIYRKYPYFKFKTQTLGWQSSVRHNLSQHHAFQKVEKDGKGWTWGIVDGISIEKERKKRATPPPPSLGQMHPQPLYQAGHPQTAGNYPYGPSPSYPTNHTQHQDYPQFHQPSQARGQAPHPTGLPANFIHSIPPQLAAPNVSTSYSSPYAPKQAGLEHTIQNGDRSHPMNSISSPVNGIEKQQSSPQTFTEASQPATNDFQPRIGPGGQESNQSQVPEPSALPHSAPTEKKAPPPPTPHINQAPIHNQTLCSSTVPQLSQSELSSQSLPTIQSATPGIHVPSAVNEDVIRAAETFKKTLLDSLKSKQSELMVNSAINRVLRLTTHNDQPANSQEDMIMAALRSLLSKIPGSNIDAENSQSTVRAHNVPNSPQPSGLQGPHLTSKMADIDKSLLTRPTFITQELSRPGGPTVPRLPMTTIVPKAINSETLNHPLSRPSPPLTGPAEDTSNTASESSLAKISAMKNGQIAGQKRTHDDTDDIQEFKRLSTSGPPQLTT